MLMLFVLKELESDYNLIASEIIDVVNLHDFHFGFNMWVKNALKEMEYHFNNTLKLNIPFVSTYIAKAYAIKEDVKDNIFTLSDRLEEINLNSFINCYCDFDALITLENK